MIAQVFINKQRVKIRTVKAREKHINDKQNIYFFGFYAQANISEIIVKRLAVFSCKFGIKNLVITIIHILQCRRAEAFKSGCG